MGEENKILDSFLHPVKQSNLFGGKKTRKPSNRCDPFELFAFFSEAISAKCLATHIEGSC